MYVLTNLNLLPQSKLLTNHRNVVHNSQYVSIFYYNSGFKTNILLTPNYIIHLTFVLFKTPD